MQSSRITANGSNDSSAGRITHEGDGPISQIYMKRCDRCGKISELALTPAPVGWVTMMDQGLGTNSCFDICAECTDEMGMTQVVRERLRTSAVEQLKWLMQPEAMPELARSLHYDEIVKKALAGDYDQAFAQADGLDLPEAISDLDEHPAELVE